MSVHLQFRVYGGFVTVSRLVARLRSLGIDIAELHVRDDRFCVHVTDAAHARRVRTVLERCPDATARDDAIPPCLAQPRLSYRSPTTYMVSSQPDRGAAERRDSRPPISA